MNWAIDNIHIQNFKFFHGSFNLELKGKNLLLYGENGCGKSSIYWSLYTLLQSCFKTPSPESGQKYFMAGNENNLRNRFCQDNEKSGITVRFVREDGHTTDYEDSSERCDGAALEDNFMRITAVSSEFLSYKFLSCIFDFKNSETADLFPIFEKDVFPTLLFSFTTPLVYIDGTEETRTQNAEYWWRYLHECIQGLPHGANPKYVLKTNKEFGRYKTLIDSFNLQLKSFLGQIVTIANQMLEQRFKSDVRIIIDYKKAHYQMVQLGPDVEKNIEICAPKINLSAKMVHNEVEFDVPRPHSFFNEAKLTCMALSLRLAILEAKYKAAGDGVSALFMDDILISLDMSNRLPVVDVLLDYANEYQLLLMTHDRAFFSIIQERLEAKGLLDKWQIKELYHQNGEWTKDGKPKHLLVNAESPIDRSKMYLCKGDYFASANALRRACEKKLHDLLPLSLQYLSKTDDENDDKNICIKQTLSQMLTTWNEYVKDKSTLSEISKNLQLYRQRIFNPMSHYDSNTPIFRSELVAALKDVENLYSIERRTIIGNDDLKNPSTYRIEVNGDIPLYLTFKFRDQYWSYHYQGNIYWNNPFVFVLDTNVRDFNKGDKVFKLDNILFRMNRIAFNDDKTRYADIRGGMVRLQD